MSHDATVNAGEIARLADVGRAAVSNWRRRYEDFPRPVGGTASSPRFSLADVEAWLRRNGKTFEMSIGDRVWQRLRASADDLRLGEMLGHAGAFLLYLRRDFDGWQRLAHALDLAVRLPPAVVAATPDLPVRPPAPEPADPELIRLIAEMAARHGVVETFEFLCERYAEVHSRRLAVTRGAVADLMTRLVCAGAGSVLDPACGMGTLLLRAAMVAQRAGGARPGTAAVRLLGQDANETVAVLAAVRLLLRGESVRIVAGDALRQDGFPGEWADAVVCDPPFNERSWGHQELVGDARWGYGMPPRGESELAWVQHCLAHVRPGGLVAILMPAAVASRRGGRRIRANLLRGGALRAVVALPPAGPDLWLLRRPEPGERPPAAILVADASNGLSLVEPAWQAHLTEADPPRGSRAVPIIDLLDDEVDLSPARHLSRRGDARGYPVVRERFHEMSAALTVAPPHLEVRSDGGWDAPVATVAELARAGMVTVHHSTLKTLPKAGGRQRDGSPRLTAEGSPVGAGGHGAEAARLPVLTADDLLLGSSPSGSIAPAPGLVTIRPGDVVASPIIARVVDAPGAVLGPHLSLFRVDPTKIDPEFLAGFLRYAAGGARPHPGSGRVDARRARLPNLPISGQRAYGAAFRRLLAVQDGLREVAQVAEELARLGVEGLVDGRLRPLG